MYDLYTFGTPNGWKASILLEELDVSYEVHPVDITKDDQFREDFVKISPNSKIPALVDRDSGQAVFESVAILMYLGEKHQRFFPQDFETKYHVIQWALFQAASIGPMFGQFGHFKVYAKEQIPYAIERYKNESLRLMGVMEKQLSQYSYIAGEDYSIADIAIWPWIYSYSHFYKEPLDEKRYPQLMKWFKKIDGRPAVQRGIQVPQK